MPGQSQCSPMPPLQEVRRVPRHSEETRDSTGRRNHILHASFYGVCEKESVTVYAANITVRTVRPLLRGTIRSRERFLRQVLRYILTTYYLLSVFPHHRGLDQRDKAKDSGTHSGAYGHIVLDSHTNAQTESQNGARHHGPECSRSIQLERHD
jgi:hypothetical protein